ncbi:O-antigen ligase family protein [uncultured Winogradskyella sp.]|uniref:O-antigen ligase family protein n=1 Tax=uncultured Winogradskyella sp. TaxID=395353 RepID=UPI0026225C52|nr:O-antigen ligase family protein [uncultured Winogradskyella sp.]
MMVLTDSFKFKLLNISLFIMFSLPVIPDYIRPYAIIFLGLSLLIANINRSFNFNLKFFLINSGIYVLMALSLFYSENLDYGFNKLETMASLIVLPLLFSFFPKFALKKVKANLSNYLLIYSIAILIYNIISLVYHFGHYGKTTLIHYPTVNRIAQGPYNIHPIYLSMHICTAILFSFFILKKLKTKWKIALMVVLDFVLLFFLFVLLKKGLIIVLGFTSIIFVLFQRSKKLLYVGFALIAINVVIIISIPQYRSKFMELTKIEDVNKGGPTSTNIRYTIYRSALYNFLKSPLIGYGLGDHKDVLLEGFKEKSKELYKNRYNTHNQYISFMLSLGIIGLLYFLYFLGFNLVLGIRYNNQLLILLVVFYGMIMLFENILERENGVIYFSFFINFFGLMSYYEHQDRKNKTLNI